MPPKAIGIDLGTTYSAIAYLDDSRRPRMIRNGLGDYLTPSAIYCREDEILFGKEAVRESIHCPTAYADSFKRDMGSKYFRQTIRDVNVPPEVISGLLLSHLICDAEPQIGPIEKAVITVPAFFDESRRRATERAGQLAGLEVTDIINEPTAAVLAYGCQLGFLNLQTPEKEKMLRVLLYDLGGGTFDVTILEINGVDFRTLATDGDVKLGGIDFDERLLNHFASEFMAVHDIDLRTVPEACANLWVDAQMAKHGLSSSQHAEVTLGFEGKQHRISVTRSEFENLIQDLIARTEITTKMVMTEAGLTSSDIDRVILVGGSTRIPYVEDVLQRMFGDKLDRSLSPDEAVAQGAALYADIAQTPQQARSFDLTNVNSHSLGVVARDPKTRRKMVSVLIPKNTALPSAVKKRFKVARNGQKNVAVNVVEGENHDPDNCAQIGQCIVRDLPPDIAAGTSVIVKFKYLANGFLNVSAKVPDARRSAQAEIRTERPSRFEEDLEFWRNRLLKRPTASADMHGESRLSELFMTIGRSAIHEDVPWSLARTRKKAEEDSVALDHAQGLLTTAMTAHENALTQAEKIQTLATSSQARVEFEKQKVKTNESIMELGRRCVSKNCNLPGLEDEIAEARQLHSRMKQEEKRTNV